MLTRTRFPFPRAAALGLLATPLAAAWSVFSEGHLDLRLLYDNTPGSGLEIRFFDLNGDDLIAPDEVTLRVKGSAVVPRPGGATWDATGAAVGAPLWLLPQAQNADLLWLGTRAAIADEVFRPLPPAPVFGSGQLALRLLAAEGSGIDAGGAFALFSSDAFGFPSFAWSTADGIDGDDVIAPINTRSHTHYNWAFSAPGDYLLTVEVIGYTRAEGTALTARATIHFQVLPTASAVAAGLHLEPAAGAGALRWERPSGDAPTVLWRSHDLERWWIEAVVEAPSERFDFELSALPDATFWRTDLPLPAP